MSKMISGQSASGGFWRRWRRRPPGYKCETCGDSRIVKGSKSGWLPCADCSEFEEGGYGEPPKPMRAENWRIDIVGDRP